MNQELNFVRNIQIYRKTYSIEQKVALVVIGYYLW